MNPSDQTAIRQIGHDGLRPRVPMIVRDNLRRIRWERILDFHSLHALGDWVGVANLKVTNRAPATVLNVVRARNAGSPTGGDPHGDGVPVIVRGRESRPHGEGGQVSEIATRKGMRNANNRYSAGYLQCFSWKTYWRAGCAERCKSGSEGGGWKRALHEVTR